MIFVLGKAFRVLGHAEFSEPVRDLLRQSAAYALRRTCHASELRATPSQISWIPSNTPSSQTAVVVRLAKNIKTAVFQQCRWLDPAPVWKRPDRERKDYFRETLNHEEDNQKERQSNNGFPWAPKEEHADNY